LKKPSLVQPYNPDQLTIRHREASPLANCSISFAVTFTSKFCKLFLQVSSNNSLEALCVPPPPFDSVCHTRFDDCSVSVNQLTESAKSFRCLYQSLVDQYQGRSML